MLKILNRIFGEAKQQETTSFKEKFLHFQALLEANDDAHKAMSELIEIIANGRPFSKGDTLKLFKDLLDRTDEMVMHLVNMAGGKHKLLLYKAKEIGETCFQILSEKISCPESWDCVDYACHICSKVNKIPDDTPYSYSLEEISDKNQIEVGGKMSRLGEIKNVLGFPVPDGFCLTARLFEDIMISEDLRNKVDEILDNIDFDNLEHINKASREIQDIFISFNIPDYIRGTILDAYDRVFPGDPEVKLSVRSSALGEDSERYSFAGIHRSELNVRRENLADACWEVLFSKYSPQSLVYRYISGLRDEDMPMSVGCIRMINSETAGILFTRDPNGRKDCMIIQAVLGLGSMAVEGQVAPQEFLIDTDKRCLLLEFKPGNQRYKNVLHSKEGVIKEAIADELVGQPCLSDDQLRILCTYASEIEKHFGGPQDIEWAIDKEGRIYILQARPLKIKSPTEGIENQQIPLSDIEAKYEILTSHGDCASSGVGSGTVFHVKSVRDINAFPKGSIVVAKKNLPEFASLIHKVSAVVTEAGSTTGHLSIIARELNVPIITNVQGAMKLLPEGSEITVYADEHKVFKGYAGDLIELYGKSNENEEYFRNSPLYRIWHSIARFIFKLHLTDPNSPKFSPEYCETIHDIIRFTHETAMKSMFSLYQNARLDRGNAYYLKFDVPLDVYVIDLGNGFKYKPERSWIKPDEIASPLFQALLKGMTTPGIRWSGHLSIDTKGYASIIFGNIVDVNRADSSLGGSSYILLSDKYLNFFSRLGYHFSRLDAYASEEINKNYINFNLRGGAADPIRRVRRVRVIGKILENLNFSVVKSEDNVIGTIRKIPEDRVYHLLSELGRLMGAIRNTDVTMVSEEYMEEFVKVFLEGDPAPAIKLSGYWK